MLQTAAPACKHMLVYTGKKLPLVDKIINNIIQEKQPRWLKFDKKQLDVIDIRTSQDIIKKVIKNKQLSPDLIKKVIFFLNAFTTLKSFVACNEKNHF